MRLTREGTPPCSWLGPITKFIGVHGNHSNSNAAWVSLQTLTTSQTRPAWKPCLHRAHAKQRTSICQVTGATGRRTSPQCQQVAGALPHRESGDVVRVGRGQEENLEMT